MQQILDAVATFEGVLILAPDAASGAPEIAWGDSFFYYAPDAVVPHNTQPYGTVVTKDYPDDTLSDLNDEGRFRVNIHVGRDRFVELVGEDPREVGPRDFAAADVFVPHPVYGALGWVSVVNPAGSTMSGVLDLLRDAHDDARRRALRRTDAAGS